jgi:hypothetical protein
MVESPPMSEEPGARNDAARMTSPTSLTPPCVSTPPGPRRSMTWPDRLLFVPLGFLWLVFLMLLAVPVMIVMTCLYYLTRAAQRLTRGRRGGGDATGAEKRLA